MSEGHGGSEAGRGWTAVSGRKNSQLTAELNY